MTLTKHILPPLKYNKTLTGWLSSPGGCQRLLASNSFNIVTVNAVIALARLTEPPTSTTSVVDCCETINDASGHLIKGTPC